MCVSLAGLVEGGKVAALRSGKAVIGTLKDGRPRCIRWSAESEFVSLRAAVVLLRLILLNEMVRPHTGINTVTSVAASG